MPDTIEQRIRDAAARPSNVPDFDALAARGRRQRHAARIGASLAVVALVAIGIGTWTSAAPSTIPVIGESPSQAPTTPVADQAPALPFGWTDVRVADARLAVPPNWDIQRQHPDDPVCANNAQTITIIDPTVAPSGSVGCRLNLPGGPVIVATPLSAEVPERLEDIAGLSGTPVTLGGDSGERLDIPTDAEDDRYGWIDAAYRSRDLDLLVVFGYADRFPTLADAVLSTVAPADHHRAEGPSSIAPFPTDTALTEPRALPSDHDGALLADILVIRPWDDDTEAPDQQGDWPPPFEPTDAADRHLVVTALAEATWGPRYAGTHFTGSGTLIYLVGATDHDSRWLRDELATQPSLADTEVTIEAVQRSLGQLMTMAEVVTDAIPGDLADEVAVRVEVEANAVVVSAPTPATADRARDVLKNAPPWVEVREGDPTSGSSND